MKKDYIEEAKEIAKSHGGTCLSDCCNGINAKILLRCKDGHEWGAIFANIKRNQWCKKCVSIKQRHTIEDCHILATKNGGICLSMAYNNNHAKLDWMCKEKHIWQASFNKISIGRWCPYCAGKAKLTIEIARQIAIERNGICLSEMYINLRNNLVWKCNVCEYIWEATLNNIKNHNRWCPKCASGKNQRLLFNIIQKIYSNNRIYNNYRGFDWLKTNKWQRQEIDIWVPDLKLAIEYDGEQHFSPVRFCSISEKRAKENLKNVKRLDKLKNKKIKEHPGDIQYFIRFKYSDKININEVLNKLNSNYIPIGVK